MDYDRTLAAIDNTADFILEDELFTVEGDVTL